MYNVYVYLLIKKAFYHYDFIHYKKQLLLVHISFKYQITSNTDTQY